MVLLRLNLSNKIAQKLKFARQISSNIHAYTQFKRRTFHVPNLMLMSKIVSSNRFAFGSAHEKFDVSTGP